MKSIVLICWISLISFSTFGQKDRLFKSLEEAATVHADSVYRLDLSKSRLTVLPEEVLLFQNLTELYLGKNKLTELPANFHLPNLSVLDLTSNKLEIFPETICKNTNLTQLLISKNKLSALPDCIGNLQNLVIIDAWFNTINEIPESFKTLKKLRSADFQGMSYNENFQKEWRDAMPWVKFEFNAGCDCGY